MFRKELKLHSGIGRILATSTSKIKKIIVRMKKRRENAARILWLGSNPHSNGLFFSFIDCFSFLFIKIERPAMMVRSRPINIISFLFIIIF